LDLFNTLNVLFQDPRHVQIKDHGDLIRNTNDALNDASSNLASIHLKAQILARAEKIEEDGAIPQAKASHNKVNSSPKGGPKRMPPSHLSAINGLADNHIAQNPIDSSNRSYRKATVEDSTDDDDEPEIRKNGSSTLPNEQPNKVKNESATLDGNSTKQSNSSVPKQASVELGDRRPSFGEKRRRMSSPDEETRLKRKHDGHEMASPWKKKTKSSHVFNELQDAAVFYTEIEFDNLSDEVDARLKVRAEERAREKARLQDTNTKRKKLSLDSVPAEVAPRGFHEQPNKRIKTRATPDTET
jgi:hypothetical protein